MDKATSKRTIADHHDGFHYEPAAGNIMALDNHTQDNCMLKPWENMKSTICLLTEWTLKAGGQRGQRVSD